MYVSRIGMTFLWELELKFETKYKRNEDGYKMVKKSLKKHSPYQPFYNPIPQLSRLLTSVVNLLVLYSPNLKSRAWKT